MHTIFLRNGYGYKEWIYHKILVMFMMCYSLFIYLLFAPYNNQQCKVKHKESTILHCLSSELFPPLSVTPTLVTPCLAGNPCVQLKGEFRQNPPLFLSSFILPDMASLKLTKREGEVVKACAESKPITCGVDCWMRLPPSGQLEICLNAH